MNPKLPIPTSIPLDVLAAHPFRFLDLMEPKKGDANRTRLKNGMLGRGELMWSILINDESDVRKWKNCGATSVKLLNELLRAHGLRLGMFPELRRARELGKLPPAGINQLFVYVPAVRPALTDKQVAFLRQPLEGAFPKSTWMNMWLGYKTCVTVFDLAVLIVHLRDDDTHLVRSCRTELEHVLGPLPMQLSDADIIRIKTETPERSYHV